MRSALVAVVLLAGLACLSQAAPVQYAVGSAFGSDAFGRLEVYGVGPSGEIEVSDQVDLPHESLEIEVDGVGRWVLVQTYDALRLFPLDQASSLRAPRSASVPGGYFTHVMAMQRQTGQFLILHGSPEQDVTTFRYFSGWVDNRLMPHLGPFTPTESTGSFSTGSMAISPIGDSTVLARGHRQLASWHLTPEGELQDDGTRILNSPFNSRWGLSPDGARAVVGGTESPHLRIISIGPTGAISTFSDLDDSVSVGNLRNPQFLPDGRGIIATGGGLYSIRLNASGEFTTELHTQPLAVPESMAVSSDGRFALTDYDIGPVFARTAFIINPDGTFTDPGHRITRGYKLADLEFVPPATLPTLLGDANVDGVVDAADVVFVINEAIPDDKPILLPQNFANADLDGDIDVDADDLEALIQLLLGL